MQDDDLIARLRMSASSTQQQAGTCPDDHQIAAYVDGSLAPGERLPVELHLADCEACAHLVGVLCRSRYIETPDAVPEFLLARARRLGAATSDRWKRNFPLLSAAAVAAVSVSVLIHFMQEPDPVANPALSVRETRAASVAQTVSILAPAAGSTVDADELVVRWEPVAGSTYYDVRIVTDTGELVAEQRVDATEWHPSTEISLMPGTDYFVRIDAYRSDSRAISSNHIPFSVSQRP